MVNYILLGTLVIGLVSFVVMYFTRSDWRATKVGQYILYFFATIAFTFGYLMISPIVGRYPGREIVDFFVLVTLNFTAWRLTLLLGKVQKHERYIKEHERELEEDNKEDIH